MRNKGYGALRFASFIYGVLAGITLIATIAAVVAAVLLIDGNDDVEKIVNDSGVYTVPADYDGGDAVRIGAILVAGGLVLFVSFLSLASYLDLQIDQTAYMRDIRAALVQIYKRNAL
ncbi:MAG TPA: hypothetical protein PKD09_11295 [Aggregatilinea sp.]|jgi:hypothetical protein|uniref:hypothetical protein n=1 Tax=Aggregatilinea sp. TaxID=2806333 RepID=UPI002CA87432|nr:hypothetical protein [Aggregatilinea sp.]HML22225.1 hypothetical protein [Aggregatilinea sp.]